MSTTRPKLLSYASRLRAANLIKDAYARDAKKKQIMGELIANIKQDLITYPDHSSSQAYSKWMKLSAKQRSIAAMTSLTYFKTAPVDAAAMIGNLSHESQVNSMILNPLAVELSGLGNNPKANGGVGLAQWTYLPRVINLVEWIGRSSDGDVLHLANPYMQLAFIAREEGGVSPWKSGIINRKEWESKIEFIGSPTGWLRPSEAAWLKSRDARSAYGVEALTYFSDALKKYKETNVAESGFIQSTQLTPKNV